jgi:hypothetical protein
MSAHNLTAVRESAPPAQAKEREVDPKVDLTLTFSYSGEQLFRESETRLRIDLTRPYDEVPVNNHIFRHEWQSRSSLGMWLACSAAPSTRTRTAAASRSLRRTRRSSSLT